MFFQHSFDSTDRKCEVQVLQTVANFFRILINVFIIRQLFAWTDEFRSQYQEFMAGPSTPRIITAIAGPDSSERATKMLDLFPYMACVVTSSGSTPLHWALDPHRGCNPEVIGKLLDIFPEAVRVRDANSLSTPINYLFSKKAFGDEDPSKISIYSAMKEKDIPNNIYTAENTVICAIVKMIVRADPSVLTMTLEHNPIQQLWHNYENSRVGKREIEYVLSDRTGFLESMDDDGVVLDKRFGGMVVVWQSMTLMVRALYAFLDSEASAKGSTPLVHACVGIGDHCSSSFLEFLLSLDPNQASLQDTHSNVPLHVAVKSNEFESAESKAASTDRLIQLHPDGLSSQNKGGQLPLTVGIIHGKESGPWVEPLMGAESMDWAEHLLLAASRKKSRPSLDMTFRVLRANPGTILL